jgi:hypothetical protein
MTTFAGRGLAALLILGAPLALAAQSAKGSATPSLAVQEFMRALADSNLTRVAQLWGNAKGPVAKTRPKGFEKRIVIMQALLRGVQATTLGDVPADKGDMRTVTTQLMHNGCRVTIPVNVVKSKGGWLVHDFDDVEASKINQPCENSKRPGN